MDGIGIESHLVQLLGYPLHISGVGMADADHRVTAIHVQILLSFVIPHVRALGFYDGDVIDRVNVE
jgi:hypothetical protein